MPHHAFGVEMPLLKSGLGPCTLNDTLYRLWAAGLGGLETRLLLAPPVMFPGLLRSGEHRGKFLSCPGIPFVVVVVAK